MTSDVNNTYLHEGYTQGSGIGVGEDDSEVNEDGVRTGEENDEDGDILEEVGEGEGEGDDDGVQGDGEDEGGVAGGDEDNEEPLYVNAKQYHRILKRRMARARLEELNRLVRSRKVSL